MPLWELTSDRFTQVARTSFQKSAVWERRDLQRILRDQIEVLDEDFMVVADEFSNWVHSDLRIDLLCIDREANLVVIELKRDDRGGHSELQAIRYAAMASTATFDQVVEAYRAYRERRHRTEPTQSEVTAEQAAQALLDFLGWDEPDDERFGNDVRIVLASSDFSIPLTSAVVWLRNRGIDIRCVPLLPYTLQDGTSERLLVDVQQLVPLPEVADLTDRMADKEERKREARAVSSSKDLRRFDVQVMSQFFEHLPKRRAAFVIARAAICDLGISPERILSETTEGRRRKYRPILLAFDGRLDQSEFMAHLTETMPTYVRRYFTDDSELMFCGGQTWAFTSQWGLETESFIRELAEQYPELKVNLTVAEEAV